MYNYMNMLHPFQREVLAKHQVVLVLVGWFHGPLSNLLVTGNYIPRNVAILSILLFSVFSPVLNYFHDFGV